MYIHSHLFCVCLRVTIYIHIYIYINMIKYRMYPAIIWADSPATISMPNSAHPPGSIGVSGGAKGAVLKGAVEMEEAPVSVGSTSGDGGQLVMG